MLEDGWISGMIYRVRAAVRTSRRRIPDDVLRRSGLCHYVLAVFVVFSIQGRFLFRRASFPLPGGVSLKATLTACTCTYLRTT